jgi:hypothetical protein
MLEPERQFRRIIGYADLAKLVIAIVRELAQPAVPIPTEDAIIVATTSPVRRAPVMKFHGERDLLGRRADTAGDGIIRLCLSGPDGERCNERVMEEASGLIICSTSLALQTPKGHTRAGARSNGTAVRHARGICQRCGHPRRDPVVHQLVPVSVGGGNSSATRPGLPPRTGKALSVIPR